MNRRQFTRGLVSLGMTPALPLPADSAGSTGAVTAAATADKMYFVGWYTARLNKTCSPEVLVSELRVDRKVAREICDRLVKSGTISPPNALGVSRTMDPLVDTMRRANRNTAKRLIKQKLETAKRKHLTKSDPVDIDDHDDTEEPTTELTDEVETEVIVPDPSDQLTSQRGDTDA